MSFFWIRKAKSFTRVCYSSKTGTWTRPQGEPELMSGHYLVSSSTTTSGGVIHWLCGTLEQMSLTHVATLHIENMGLSYLELPPEEKHIKIPVMVATLGIKAKVRLKMFRSGAVVLRVVGEGLFLFNLSDRSMRRIDSVVTKKYFLCPYDIDWLSCLAITNLVVDGSLSLDVERKKGQDRWRRLMGMDFSTNGAS
uniref:Uncharacterized protein n=1 Tax=Aegilops tauschii TaxID=37682 RepID=M8C791_AEGTA